MNENLLVDHDSSGWSARFAVRVTSAIDLSALRGEVGRPVGEWFDLAHGHDVEYLRRLSTVAGAAFELRWLAEPGRPLSLTLLGRLHRRHGTEIERDGAEALARLAAVPAHVRVRPLAGRAAIEHAFDPFRPRGIAEVRKPCLTARPHRPDAPVRVFVAVPPLRAQPGDWPGVLEFLADARRPAMLSVGLVPTGVAPSFGQYLSLIADHYGVLGRPGRSRMGNRYAMPGWIDGDPFAAVAEPLYRDAARRYQGTVFRLRITVATAGPPDLTLAHGIAERLGRGIARDVPGRSCVVEWPAAARDRMVLTDSVRALGTPRWGGHEVWRSKDVPQALRELCELADPAEAAAAAWLPAAVEGTLPGSFPVTLPAGEGDFPDGFGDFPPVAEPRAQDKRVSPPAVP
ncbi:hypothetical protein [Actinophytocola sediminis]